MTVRGGSDLVNTQTATVSATLNVDQINKMPLPTRNAINAVTFLPGVNTAGVNRDSNFNGLPDSFVGDHARRREQQRQLQQVRPRGCSRW